MPPNDLQASSGRIDLRVSSSPIRRRAAFTDRWTLRNAFSRAFPPPWTPPNAAMDTIGSDAPIASRDGAVKPCSHVSAITTVSLVSSSRFGTRRLRFARWAHRLVFDPSRSSRIPLFDSALLRFTMSVSPFQHLLFSNLRTFSPRIRLTPDGALLTRPLPSEWAVSGWT